MDWERLIRRLEALLRLKTFPVGLRLVEDPAEMEANPWVRRLPHKVTLCQLMTIVRTFDWTVGAVAEDLATINCASIVGLAELPEWIRDGSMRATVWLEKKEEAAACEALIPRVPPHKYKAVLLAPQVYNPFEPHAVFVYANPAQMSLLINAIQFDRYERLTFYSVGETSCGDVIARCLLEGVPALSVPCFGERRFGHALDDELAMGLPPGEVDRIVANLEELYRRGIRYPVAQWGAWADPTPALAAVYGQGRL